MTLFTSTPHLITNTRNIIIETKIHRNLSIGKLIIYTDEQSHKISL